MIGIHQRPAVARGLARSSWGIRVMMATSLTCLLAGCAIGTSQGPPSSVSPQSPTLAASRPDFPDSYRQSCYLPHLHQENRRTAHFAVPKG